MLSINTLILVFNDVGRGLLLSSCGSSYSCPRLRLPALVAFPLDGIMFLSVMSAGEALLSKIWGRRHPQVVSRFIKIDCSRELVKCIYYLATNKAVK